jgi:hypothetical protein
MPRAEDAVVTLGYLHEVEVKAVALARLTQLLGPDRAEQFGRTAAATRARLSGRRVVNVNSTATGGGVAELLQALLSYAKGAGVDARWVVIEGDARFFEITKRIHNHLYGTEGDGGPLGEAEHRHYEKTASRAPPHGRRRNCGVALPRRHRYAERTFETSVGVPAAVSRRCGRVRVLTSAVRAVMGTARPSRRHCTVDRSVLRAHLVLAGPEANGVADDPEANDVLGDCLRTWKQLPDTIRQRVHLVCVPMADPDEAAVIVNALQRHSTVVVQKSLAEGFGLTVTEAMWKHRPVVASKVGGIVDQIINAATGTLIDAGDLDQYAQAVCALLDDRVLAAQMGIAGYARVRAEFLGDRHLEQWAQLFERLA